jgi:hypothetical protein
VGGGAAPTELAKVIFWPSGDQAISMLMRSGAWPARRRGGCSPLAGRVPLGMSSPAGACLIDFALKMSHSQYSTEDTKSTKKAFATFVLFVDELSAHFQCKDL